MKPIHLHVLAQKNQNEEYLKKVGSAVSTLRVETARKVPELVPRSHQGSALIPWRAGVPASAGSNGPPQLTKAKTREQKRSLLGVINRREKQHMRRRLRRLLTRQCRKALKPPLRPTRKGGERVGDAHEASVQGEIVFSYTRFWLDADGCVTKYETNTNHLSNKYWLLYLLKNCCGTSTTYLKYFHS